MSIIVAAIGAVVFDAVVVAAAAADTAVVVGVVVVVAVAVLCMHIKLHPHFTARFQRNSERGNEIK